MIKDVLRGFRVSVSHPGGNMTGVSFEAASDTYAKRLQMLKEVLTSLQKIAVLAAQGDPNVTFAMESFGAGCRCGAR